MSFICQESLFSLPAIERASSVFFQDVAFSHSNSLRFFQLG